MLVRITKLPEDGDLDELDLRHFRAGNTYDVTAQLGMLLIVGGYAEVAHVFTRSQAADFHREPRPKPRRRR